MSCLAPVAEINVYNSYVPPRESLKANKPLATKNYGGDLKLWNDTSCPVRRMPENNTLTPIVFAQQRVLARQRCSKGPRNLLMSSEAPV